jgi:DNA-binding NarL/FixJ family response regulator
MPTSSFDSMRDALEPALDEAGFSGLVRLLLVEKDRAYAVLIDQVLKSQLPDGSQVEHADSVAAAREKLNRQSYDAVLLDLSLTDGDGLETLTWLSREHPSAPIIVMSGHEDSATFIQARARGARDVLFKSRLDGLFLGEAIKRAMRGAPAPTNRKSASAAHRERRRHPRYPAAGAAVIVPIESGFRPGKRIVGTLLNISRGGVGLLAEQGDTKADKHLVGIEYKDGSYHYATVRFRHRQSAPEGLMLGGEFVAGADDPFAPQHLVPQLDTRELRLKPRMAEEVLHHWTVYGVMRPYLIDRVKTCPKCRSLPTFRDGCSHCGSARIASSPIIHHIACAHEAPAEEFVHAGALVCPKCHAQGLVIGAEFEHLPGPCRCLDCNWADAEPTSIGECLKCALRFPASKAFESEVVQFHMERLDPMSFVDQG